MVRGIRLPKANLAIVSLLLILIGLPIVFVLYGSVRSEFPGHPEGRFSLDALQQVYTTGPFLRTLLGTAALSITVALLSTMVGAFFAWVLARSDIPFKKLWELAIIAPIFLSPFVGALAWLTLASPRSGMINVLYRQLSGGTESIVNIMTTWGIVFVMTIYYIPYAFLFVIASLRQMDPSLEEASYMTGASISRTVWRVTVPLVRPAMAASFFFIAVLAAGMFSVPAVLTTSGAGFVPLAVRLQRSVATAPINHALAASIGTLLLLLALVGIVMYRRSIARSHRYITVTGRGFRPRLIPVRGFRRTVVLACCVLYGLMAVALPYLALVVISLTPYAMTNLTDLELSIVPLVTTLTSSGVLDATRNTLVVALATSTICVFIGAIVAYMVERARVPGRKLIDYLATIPIAVPGIVFATGMVWAYIRTPLYATLWILMIAFIASYLPHTVRLASNGLLQIDRALEEASTMCSAPTSYTLRRIVLPLSKPALLSAWIMVFIFTIREINAAIVLYSPGNRVLSIVAWNFIESGTLGKAAAVGLLQTGILVLALTSARYIFRVRLESGA